MSSFLITMMSPPEAIIMHLPSTNSLTHDPNLIGFMGILFGGDIAAMRGKFFRHAGSRYILFEKETTWNEANYGLCHKLGSNPRQWTLASMPTRNEFDKIATKLQQLRSGSCQDTWIGLMKYRYNVML